MLVRAYDQARERGSQRVLVRAYDDQARERGSQRVLVRVYDDQARAEENHHPCPSLGPRLQHRRGGLTPINCCP